MHDFIVTFDIYIYNDNHRRIDNFEHDDVATSISARSDRSRLRRAETEFKSARANNSFALDKDHAIAPCDSA